LIEDRAGFYLDKGLDQPVNTAKRPNDPPETSSRKKKVECIKEKGEDASQWASPHFRD
jgi:hypothetical protein